MCQAQLKRLKAESLYVTWKIQSTKVSLPKGLSREYHARRDTSHVVVSVL